MKEFSKWKESEIKNLFNCIAKTKKENKSLLEGFKEYAKKSKRKANSVRNYYYLEVENLSKNSNRAKKLGIDLSLHLVQQPEKFSNFDTEKLVTEILRLKCLGYSIRKACLKLANNSAEEMLRYQNKFRSVMKNNRKLYDRCLASLKKNGLSNSNYEDKNKNVIYMKRPEDNKLSDEDVNSLFLGLVRLVKKSAMQTVEKRLINETEMANSSLRETLIKVSSLERQIEQSEQDLINEQEKNRKISEENIELKTKIANITTEKIIKSHRNKSLSKYLRDIKAKGFELKTKI